MVTGPGAGTAPASAATPAQATEGPEQPPAVHPTGVTAWPERLPGAVPTGTTTRTEPAPAEVAFPSSVPVFQLDTAAFEPPTTGIRAKPSSYHASVADQWSRTQA